MRHLGWRRSRGDHRVRWLGRLTLLGLLGTVGVAVLLLGLGATARDAGAAGEQIVVSTDPPLSQIHPHGGPSAALPDKLVVEVKDASGRNIPNVLLDVQVDTPPTNWFVSTDVPRIEGVTALIWSAVAPDGRQEIAYIFPIRGPYHVTVRAAPAPGAAATFSPITRETTVDISEKPTSVLYLALFLAVLFLFGAVSGLVLGRANRAGRAGG